MEGSTTGTRLSIPKLIFVPAVITLMVTILRLAGEVQHWPKALFNAEAGGPGAIVGIAWLPFIFGPYFAVKLARSGDRPSSVGKTLGFVFLGLAVAAAGGFVGFAPQIDFPGKILVGILLLAAAGALQFPGWPSLAKSLVAYGYGARLPVAIVMYFAIRGGWGTHYDALPPNYDGPMTFWGKYFLVALVPQLVFWVVYTMLIGALLGAVAVAIMKRDQTAPQPTA
jgi:hypothetical protein